MPIRERLTSVVGEAAAARFDSRRKVGRPCRADQIDPAMLGRSPGPPYCPVLLFKEVKPPLSRLTSLRQSTRKRHDGSEIQKFSPRATQDEVRVLVVEPIPAQRFAHLNRHREYNTVNHL